MFQPRALGLLLPAVSSAHVQPGSNEQGIWGQSHARD